MKNAYLHPLWGLFLLFSVQGLFAQPTLTSASNPQIGQSWNAVLADPTGFDPGPAGADQSWNFSNLDTAEAPALFSFEVRATAGNPLAADYPNATHIIYWTIFGLSCISTNLLTRINASLKEELPGIPQTQAY